ncbi:hypothetical protein [Adhaeribacter aquaticus]|uniref:hypothetical protein n=1 Tax=Adhaeribacter aquaticus TaxID=299567 RepID=UPI0003FCFC3C|nr:hypothetical protein [Adhaeribacter aquaticus]
MKVTGNITQIKNKRSNQHKDIEIHVDKIEYITQRKDGRYYQPFDLTEELETPLVITGDCLARTEAPNSEEGELEFKVYDKIEEEYVLNPHKQLLLSMVYDFDEDENILTSVIYSVTIDNEEFKNLENKLTKEKIFKNRGTKRS